MVRLPFPIFGFWVLLLSPVLWAHDGWRVLPIRSQEEYQAGRMGGEAEQHFHGMARCFSDPNILYGAHDAGQVWKSVNGGRSWQRTLGKGLWLFFGQTIEVDPVNPDHVFFMADNSYNWLAEDFEGVYRSQDGGISWELVLAAPTHYDSASHRITTRNIAFDPTSSQSRKTQRWYAAVQRNGLYRSETFGQTWTLVSSLAGHDAVFGVVCHPLDGTILYLASSEGLYRSTDRGQSLQPFGDLPAGEVSSAATHPADPDILYATVRGRGLYRSDNGGAHFSLLKSLDAVHVFINPGFPEVLFLTGEESNTLISHNGGQTWIEDMVTVPAPGLGREGAWKSAIAGDITAIVPNPRDPQEAVAISRATIWRTQDGGHTFTDSSTLFTGFAASWWNDSFAFDPHDPDRLALFNCDVGMTITRTAGDYFDRRNDQAWDWYGQGLISWIGTYAGDFQPVADSHVIVASIGNYFDTEIMRSADEGKTWSLVTSSPEMNLFIAFHPHDPNLVFAGNKVSRNAGVSFEPVNFGSYQSVAPSVLGMCAAAPDTLYAMDQNRSRILRSDNRGQTWTLYTQPGWRFRVLDGLPTFAVDPADPDIVYTLNAQGDLAVYNGSVWRSTGVLNLAGGQELGNFVRTVAVDPRFPDILYAGMQASGISCIWRSMDKGYTWVDITYNMPRLGTSSMAVHPHTGELLRGGSCGTWVFPPPYAGDYRIYNRSASMPVDWSFQMQDWVALSKNWLASNCGSCLESDWTFDGTVDLEDLIYFASRWLKRVP